MRANVDISIVIITLGRVTVYKTLEAIFGQLTTKNFEIIMILQGEIDKGKIFVLNKTNIPIRIISYPYGLGFGKYRNEGIFHSQGDIIVFIDDDEWTKDHYWLVNLTKPIFEMEYSFTTSGYDITLTGDYITDCISLMGYPGGGAVGFDKMWPVNDQNETKHLCSGNFAFDKKTGLIFHEKLKHGAEDVEFGIRVIKNEYRIKYVKEATVFHVSRSGMANFINWHKRRGISIYEFKNLGLLDKKTLYLRYWAIINIFKNIIATKYIFGITILFILQYFASIFGFIQALCHKSLEMKN